MLPIETPCMLLSAVINKIVLVNKITVTKVINNILLKSLLRFNRELSINIKNTATIAPIIALVHKTITDEVADAVNSVPIVLLFCPLPSKTISLK